MKKVLLLLTVLLIAIYVSLYTSLGIFLRWGVDIAKDGYRLAEIQNQKETTMKNETIKLTKDESLIVITRIKLDSNQKLISDRQILFESLFEPMTNPYPEVVSSTIKCPDEFKPVKKIISNGLYYILGAGDRMNFGVCAKDLIRYSAIYGLFDCKQKGVYEIQVFEPLDSVKIEETIKSFSCEL